jgi:hypothetical protein
MNIFLVFFHRGNQAFSIFKYKQIMILASEKTQKKKGFAFQGISAPLRRRVRHFLVTKSAHPSHY